MASLMEMEKALQDKHWEEVAKKARKNKILNAVRLVRSNKPLNLNEGMEDYNNRKSAEQNGIQAKPRTSQKEDKEFSSKLVKSTDLFDTEAPKDVVAEAKPKETITRAEERQAASNIFNSGKKKQAPAKVNRESAPVIDFEMLASRGYAEPTMKEKPGDGLQRVEGNGDTAELTEQTALSEPKVRLGKDLMYSKAKERSADELAEQNTISEPKAIDDRLLASFKDTAQYEGARYEDPKIQAQFEEWKASNAPKETKAPNYDDMWANASNDVKAKFAEFMAQNTK